MKKILISIKPKYVAEILNHRKTLEIRKSCPKCELPCEVYIYCTKANSKNPYLAKEWGESDHWDKCSFGGYGYSTSFAKEDFDEDSEILNGKVVAKFTLKGVETVEICECEDCVDPRMALFFGGNEEGSVVKACLSDGQIADYLGYEHAGYAWEISDLVIFDKPRELKEFKKVASKKTYTDLPWLEPSQKAVFKSLSPLTKAPQSWCYAEVDE